MNEIPIAQKPISICTGAPAMDTPRATSATASGLPNAFLYAMTEAVSGVSRLAAPGPAATDVSYVTRTSERDIESEDACIGCSNSEPVEALSRTRPNHILLMLLIEPRKGLPGSGSMLTNWFESQSTFTIAPAASLSERLTQTPADIPCSTMPTLKRALAVPAPAQDIQPASASPNANERIPVIARAGQYVTVMVRCLLLELVFVQLAVAQVPAWPAAMVPVIAMDCAAPVPAEGTVPSASVYARFVALSVTDVWSRATELIGSVFVQRMMIASVKVAALAWNEL
jgi:hypothetical protein